jgi:hypothetical protein
MGEGPIRLHEGGDEQGRSDGSQADWRKNDGLGSRPGGTLKSALRDLSDSCTYGKGLPRGIISHCRMSCSCEKAAPTVSRVKYSRCCHAPVLKSHRNAHEPRQGPSGRRGIRCHRFTPLRRTSAPTTGSPSTSRRPFTGRGCSSGRVFPGGGGDGVRLSQRMRVIRPYILSL